LSEPIKAMDKKAKKRTEVLRKKIAQLQQLLAAAKQQPDDPDEPARLQADLDKAQKELHELKDS
jgi:transcriptional/translational regulatory protein YebC/TACO1